MVSIRHVIFNIRNARTSVRRSSTQAPRLINMVVDDEGIATVMLQRSPVNSLNRDVLRALCDSIDEVSRNKCKGLVLTSAFPTVFSAGIDLTELYKPDLKRLQRLKESLFDVVEKLFNADVITTIAINGHTAAGGCILAMLCEYRAMVSGGATIGFNDTAVGVVPARWITDLLIRNMGEKRAEYAITASVMVTAEDALKIGFIDEVATGKEDAIEKCKKYIKMFDSIPHDTRIRTKRALREKFLNDVKTNRQQYVEDFVKSTTAPQTQEKLSYYIQMLKQKKKSK